DITNGDRILLDSLADALSVTKRVCASVSVATTRSGINMEAVRFLEYLFLLPAFS
ncbi:DUF711 family protein, partial [Bacillaceae bacterium Marseille-Q3522]|nr:DUF711 family protein [Bacillaceae bacterium Marseille-Q3522]